MVPSDEIYGEIFRFDSPPFSAQANTIGYASSYTIENTGSLFILLFAIALRQVFFFTAIKINSRFKKFNKWSKKKHRNFFWAGAIDFFSEMYLCMVFSLGINTSYFRFTNPSESINNLFMIFSSVIVIVVPPYLVITLKQKLTTPKKITKAKPQLSGQI